MSAALRILIDLDIFKLMVESGDTFPKQASQIAEMSGADPALVQRLLKRVASSSPPLIEESGPDEYRPNRWTRAFADNVSTGAFTDVYDGWTSACSKVIEFMRKTNYRNPIDKDNTVWKFGAGVDVPYFTWMETQDDRQNWYNTVPVSEVFPAEFDPDKALMVDVGGNAGHDILGFHRTHPKQPGRLILQDLPGQIQPLDTRALAPVELVCHDFFTPQPFKGAKVYYLKMVLHDWPDIQRRSILENLKPALTPGYSKILINEMVVLDQGADSFSTSVDLLMMIFHSSWERQERQWRELVESVGLKVTRILAVWGRA